MHSYCYEWVKVEKPQSHSVAGLVVGLSLLGLALLMACIFCMFYLRRRRRQRDELVPGDTFELLDTTETHRSGQGRRRRNFGTMAKNTEPTSHLGASETHVLRLLSLSLLPSLLT